ncbi:MULTISPECIES: D-alanyl-D-alanine carboxypeptidase [Rhodopseudomonas]|uniref:Peptidase M15 n=1 Tax=Rhodopseudomonas palustris TaxID=1076 RepID=A0A0D7EIC3_RHOPL|nr:MULTISPECIES: D-alanyl-D-alanine carboxypeptidase [Rhodopseudomonas]KIZ40594.1 peptidase M15 [Rhodopseudomonas palustris]MDF3809487.1 D-alanyl-D-alanine carboxypeptidase [Rhodopseudomonas sp. BAL398]WOK19373.1 D-alanyl-D-alanine carboxypeptidase [Rhodopseudomonas sp. BAL398]
MHRTHFAHSRTMRACALGLATIFLAVLFTNDTADARRKHRSHTRHHVARYSYNPPFASIIVDANSGATLTATNPDALRHPASLTKIMTLYLLFERLESGKIDLDSEMEVSQHASIQAPTKLGLRPGQTLRVEDAIKALVTRSANDAAVVIAEAIAGDEGDFAKLMTRKARSLGMTRTVYRNASGLPDDDQVTTARDQSILGRAVQERFPRYYRYFSTSVFNYRGHAIRNHNHLIGSVEGVDGIKTGYTRDSGFNLVTSIHRGNRFLVGVVLGGRSGSARDATMRKLLAENLDKASTRRTAAAIVERSTSTANAEVAEAAAASRPTQSYQVEGAVQVASAAPAKAPMLPVARPSVPPSASLDAVPMPEPGPFNSGTIQTRSITAIPGSTDPMKPVRVKTVHVRSAPLKLASAMQRGPDSAVRAEAPETSGSINSHAEMPPQPANHGTGHGLLGVLPASSLSAGNSQVVAYAAEQAPQPTAIQHNGGIKPAPVRTGWIIQVGALESESQALKRIEVARDQASGMLGKADSFTEPVVMKGEKLFRARFAGLDRHQAEAACRKLKRNDISCFAIRN